MPNATPQAPSSANSSGKHYFAILWAWWVRFILFFWPDIPIVMRLRGWLYGLLMRNCGANFQVAHNVVLNGLEHFEIGRNTYFAPGCVVIAGSPFRVGDNCIIGPNNLFSTNNHKFNGTHFREGIVEGEVNIGPNCWVGGNCSILMGTTLHDATVVGAGSVTNKDYERGRVLVAGVPARIIKDIDS